MAVDTSSASGGLAVLEATAPQVATAFARLVEIRPLGVHDELLQHPAVRAFAERFRTDVTSIDEPLRAGFMQATGDRQVAVAQMVWIGDMVPRGRAALDALFGPSAWLDPRRYPVAQPSTVIEDFRASVARLDALDPTLTEVVRLRGARQHDCRLCRTRRSVAAMEHGATEADYDAVDDHEHSDLSPEAKAALLLVDAMIRTPDAIPAATVDAVLSDLGETRAVEVVLDVVRNGVNKLAVGLGADAAEVTEGVQWFRTDADGTIEIVPA